jgi:hypothetical protein
VWPPAAGVAQALPACRRVALGMWAATIASMVGGDVQVGAEVGGKRWHASTVSGRQVQPHGCDVPPLNKDG